MAQSNKLIQDYSGGSMIHDSPSMWFLDVINFVDKFDSPYNLGYNL